ncbi:MAG: MarR family winged helix-turn-helix transcriptional regulator [Actinomycetota bacterium]|nr:MarR family winged helix-turn-helix transcriptional regulator [Actinomycetota bacterium]
MGWNSAGCSSAADPADRRLYAVYLTDAGNTLLKEIGRVARAHEDAMLAALDDTERAQLHPLLARIAADQDLTAAVHPGYRALPTTSTKPARRDEQRRVGCAGAGRRAEAAHIGPVRPTQPAVRDPGRHPASDR